MARARISKKSKSVLIGLVCGTCCALCVGAYILQVDEQASAAQTEMLAKYGGDQVEVCVARRDIVVGETINASDVETKKWIASLLPADAVSNKEDVIGKQVGSTILAGEVISSARFGSRASDVEVPDGLTAISVPTQDVQAVGGAISPGMKIDVYAIGASSTTKLASSVLVLATSMQDDAISRGSSAWLTLAIDPSRVEEMVAAAENLQLYFTLPSSADIASPSNEEASSGTVAKTSSNKNDRTAESRVGEQHG